jgi:hypothetical protein
MGLPTRNSHCDADRELNFVLRYRGTPPTASPDDSSTREHVSTNGDGHQSRVLVQSLVPARYVFYVRITGLVLMILDMAIVAIHVLTSTLCHENTPQFSIILAIPRSPPIILVADTTIYLHQYLLRCRAKQCPAFFRSLPVRPRPFRGFDHVGPNHTTV